MPPLPSLMPTELGFSLTPSVQRRLESARQIKGQPHSELSQDPCAAQPSERGSVGSVGSVAGISQGMTCAVAVNSTGGQLAYTGQNVSSSNANRGCCGWGHATCVQHEWFGSSPPESSCDWRAPISAFKLSQFEICNRHLLDRDQLGASGLGAI